LAQRKKRDAFSILVCFRSQTQQFQNMAFRFAVLAALLVPAASLTLIKGTSELKQFGQVTMGSELHPEQTARLLASVQDTWRTEAARSEVESLTSFPKSCSTVASAALMGSSGDHDRVQEYMANVCKQPVLDLWHQTTCNKFKVSLGKACSIPLPTA